MIHIYNGILLNHKKEQYWVICSDVTGPRGFPVGSVVKNLPDSAGDARDRGSVSELEDPLEKEIATHSNTLAWKMPWTEECGRLQSMGCKELDTTERLSLHFHSQN